MRRLLNLMTLYDKIFILFVIIFSLTIFLYPLFFANGTDEGNEYIAIKSGKEVVEKIPLSATYEEKVTIEVKGPIGISVIEAINGKVRMLEAPPEDPLRVCEKTGWIDRPGPSIICIPNRISISIKKGGEGLDGVSW